MFGSTGSIGQAALSIVRNAPEKFEVVALIAGSNVDELERQALEFKPKYLGVYDSKNAVELSRRLSASAFGVEVLSGEEIHNLGSLSEVDIVVASIVGSAGLRSTYNAVKAGKVVALANKESLVCAGELLTKEKKISGSWILPVDSEHSAIFQALQGSKVSDVARLILTASGGPFRNTPLHELDSVTPEMALRHPRWKMGPKVTVDSSTMFNKALELIEAKWLFGLDESCIDILIHPQSIVHSLVEYCDGSQIAQLGVPDMRVPIAYALSYPEKRLADVAPRLDLAKSGPLEFEEVEDARFPAIGLAREVLQRGGGSGVVFNAANEVAVKEFLCSKLSYKGIFNLVKKVLDKFESPPLRSIEDVLEVDTEVREYISRDCSI